MASGHDYHERTKLINKLQKHHPSTRRQRNAHGCGKFTVDFFDKATGTRVASYDVSDVRE